ncbi:hypothetical protein C8R45DRAFT_1207868 [Mycena sanguinolenta]|nr:hypothetical protein C8R45DRAFT_1207868 [Mycena sanguinolenta]
MSIIIDDDDPLVLYSPPSDWNLRGEAPEFDATTHTSATAGSTASLVFEGTSISVYGTIGVNPGLSSLTFSIDGADIGFYQAPVLVAEPAHNLLFWISPTFTEARHELIVTVDQNATQQNTILFLDYFIYTTTSTTGKTLLIDDADASVTYSPDGWESSNTSDSSLAGTQHVVSTSVGSWATTSFNGTGISIVGTPPQTGFIASIVIDGSTPLTSQLQTQNPNQLFSTIGLPSGSHTINFTVLEGNSLGIDYFLVIGSALEPSATPQSQPLPSPSHPSSTLAQSRPVPSASHPSVTPQSSKKLLIAAVVGAACGGLVILVLLLATIVWKRRGRARSYDTSVSAFPGPRWMRSDVHPPSVTALLPQSKSSRMESRPPDPPAYTLKYSRAVRQ